MSAETLFDLGFEHLQAFLLAFIPAVITLTAMIYIWLNFPAYKINRVYLLFLLSIFTWQLNDSLSRMSNSEETARSWDRLLAIGWMLQFPCGIHWTLLLTREKKLSYSPWFLILLYFSAFFFSVLLCAGFFTQSFTYSPFLGWTKTFSDNSSYDIIPPVWICVAVVLNIMLLASFAYKNRHSPETKFESILILAGYCIPAVQGILTQILFAFLLNIDPIPITSTLMITIVLMITGLKAFKIFNLSETLDTEHIAEIIQEIIFVVSPQRTITYMNSYAASVTGITKKGRKKAWDIFAGSEATYQAFEKQVLIPAFEKMDPSAFQFSADDSGKQIHWEVTVYPIINKTMVEGLLLICRDVADRALMAEARLAGLRSQMNPHFIFNSLNSIQHYIHTFQREAAESFLSTFSTLIRQILDHSMKPFIPLSDELQTIELYLKLEKARFGGRLSYEINTGGSLDTENLLVPSMLIQPYIENAVIHGLANKEKGGTITVNINKEDVSIVCIVEDDGAGRQKAMELKNLRAVKNISHGTSITRTRLELLNQQLNVPVSVQIIDLYNERKEPAGTRVIVHIPLNERF